MNYSHAQAGLFFLFLLKMPSILTNISRHRLHYLIGFTPNSPHLFSSPFKLKRAEQRHVFVFCGWQVGRPGQPQEAVETDRWRSNFTHQLEKIFDKFAFGEKCQLFLFTKHQGHTYPEKALSGVDSIVEKLLQKEDNFYVFTPSNLWRLE